MAPNEVELKSHRNLGLQKHIVDYPFQGYPHDVSEDGTEFMVNICMKPGSTPEDFKRLARRLGMVPATAMPGSGQRDTTMQQFSPPPGSDLPIVFLRAVQNVVIVAVNGQMQRILDFVTQAHEGELVSQTEFQIGPVARYLDAGKLLWEMGNVQEAIAQYDNGGVSKPTCSPGDSRLMSAYRQAIADCHYNLGLAHRKLSNRAKAQNHFHEYLKIDSTSQWADKAHQYLRELG